MLQIFYLEVIKDPNNLAFTQNQTISSMFSSRPSHPIMRWKSHTIVNQPQGQGGLSSSEFKDNVTGLNFCEIDDCIILKNGTLFEKQLTNSELRKK